MSEPTLPLEPDALKLRPDHDGQIRLSLAISLKRIADVLDGTALGLCVTQTIFNPATPQNRDVRNNY